MEIVSNELIRNPGHLVRALVSDNWAFRATGNRVRSPFWRPCRTLWLAAGHRILGVSSPLGWHLASLALHLGVLAAAQTLLRRLGAPPTLTAAALLLFAVHPTRVESVTWISGFQDPLMALFLLSGLAVLLGPAGPAPRARSAAAVGLFALGLLSKETAITFPAVVFAALLSLDLSAGGRSWRDSAATALRKTVPFLVAGAAYLAARKAILGVFLSAPSPVPLSVIVSTIPVQMWFYLAESLFPSVSPLHPVGPVLPGAAGASNLWLPLVLGVAAIAVLVAAARRSPLRATGLSLFLFFLAPALGISSLSADRTVQDRYLYLPLLGLLMVGLPALAGAASRLFRIGSGNADRAVLVLAIAASVPLGIETARYARAWRSDATLWEWGVRTVPDSAGALGQHAVWLYRAGRIPEAKAFVERALRADPGSHDAVLTGARIAEAERRLGDAEGGYRLVVKLSPDAPESWEESASFYRRNGRPEEALRLLGIARERLPRMRAAFTDAMASVLHELGRTDEALRELESVRSAVQTEFHPASPSVLFHIGLMNLELGRPAEGRRALEEFLGASERADNPEIVRRRGEAARILRGLTLPASAVGQEASPLPGPSPAPVH